MKVIEDYALQNVKNIALTNKIPPGFFRSLNTYDSGADIQVNKQYVLPSQSRFKEIDDYISFLPFNDRLLWQQYTHIIDGDEMKRYEFIMRAYKATNGNIEKQNKKEMLDMLDDNQEYIVEKSLIYNKTENIAFLLSLNICTKTTIKKIIKAADETDDVSLKAYALEALNKLGRKTDFKI